MTSPRTLLKAWGLTPNKALGQNFLADPACAQSIVDLSGISVDDIVLEIGAGLGSLTIPIARKSKMTYAVEKDRRMIELLQAEILLSGLHNVAVIDQDILGFDIQAWGPAKARPIVVMGNLPYNISSQILIQLIRSRSVIRRAVLMFQKEPAIRLMAPPGGKAYGRISVMLQYCAHTQKLLELPAERFYPRPKIDSLVLCIDFKEKPDYPADDEALLFKVVKAAFGQRRKTLKNALKGSELHLDHESAEFALAQSGILPDRRAETLGVEEFVNLSNAIGRVAVNREL
jgi:16S rRNA (adenine1518-N6/adenine1519-N6)-dimethyltransferase